MRMTEGCRGLLCGIVLLGSTTVLVSCAGTKETQFTLDPNHGYDVNIPVKNTDCYDAAVLLALDLDSSHILAKKVLAALDATISLEQPSLIEAQRNRHLGLFVGSGGEELVVRLTEDGAGNTLVAVTTKTGFVGGAGQTAWSCIFVDNLVQLAPS